jgi:riboflavin synthase
MFTGIIQEVGVVQKRERKEENVLFTIQAPHLTPKLKEGDSVSVNGVCLTVEHLFQNAFKAAAVPQTLETTNLGAIRVSQRVNLEPALKAEDKLSGHYVTGHIDTMGEILGHAQIKNGTGVEISFPPEIANLLALKGSVTLNGISLTIADLKESSIVIALIPFTLENTNLGDLREGDMINIEVDIIARYLDRLLHGKESEVRYAWLKERNFI